MNREALQLLLAQGESVERIATRFGRHPSTVSYWMKKHGLAAPNHANHAAKGGINRERLAALVTDGLSITEIAQEVAMSKATVRYWLRRHGLRTQRAVRVDTKRASRHAGTLELPLVCSHHGPVQFILEGRGYYRCKRCRQERVARRRRAVKALLVANAGGACCVCGYDRYLGALQFHHLDPKQKRLELNTNGLALSIVTAQAEARKCALLCSNCHAELEGGVIALVDRVRAPEADLE
ncbi:MAG: helix-turn-helix domain-containing protein [Actinomycetota bacterium]|nr:helix-turn-helix domain-containing protein [Actinomycetota bacterium]